MSIDYERLLNFPPKEEEVKFSARDTILYALGVGLGNDPLDERQLRYLYEKDLVALPTFAMAVGHPGWWLGSAGLDPERVVHAGKRIEVLAPMPAEGEVYTRSVVTGVSDKGVGKHALIHTQRDLWDKRTGQHLSRQINTILARGQGGFGGPDLPSTPPHTQPTRTPDVSCDLETLVQQALLFRLSGDLHPIHVDPQFARRSGFSRPILHGLATMAIAGHALIRSLLDYDVVRLAAIECRFTSPVFPGDTITTDFWMEGSSILFTSRVAARDALVLSQGAAELHTGASI